MTAQHTDGHGIVDLDARVRRPACWTRSSRCWAGALPGPSDMATSGGRVTVAP